jgi:hypothetical protein
MQSQEMLVYHSHNSRGRGREQVSSRVLRRALTSNQQVESVKGGGC